MKLKNILKNFTFAGIIVGVSLSSASAANICPLIKELQGVFSILRTLAFVGAAFMLAGWAWGYISGGESKMEDIKKKGIALLVGFSILFAVGIVLQFVLSGTVNDCGGALWNW